METITALQSNAALPEDVEDAVIAAARRAVQVRSFDLGILPATDPALAVDPMTKDATTATESNGSEETRSKNILPPPPPPPPD